MTTIVLQPAEADAFDTYICSQSPTTNFYTSPTIYIGDIAGTSAASRILIKYTLPAILIGTTITAVTFSLWESIAGNNAGRPPWSAGLRRVLLDWVENQTTWNIYSTGNNWIHAGCSTDGTDRVASDSAAVTLDGSAGGTWVHWTSAGLVSDVQGFIDGTFPNYGWLLQAPDAENTPVPSQVSYNGFIAAADIVYPTRRPKLTIEYTESSSGVIPILARYSFSGGTL